MFGSHNHQPDLDQYQLYQVWLLYPPRDWHSQCLIPIPFVTIAITGI